MHTLEIPEANINLTYPSELSECNYLQYINMSSLLFKYASGEITLEYLKHQAVYFLLNLKKSITTNQITDLVKFSNIDLIAQSLESFFEVNDQGEKTIKQYFIHNPIEKVHGVFKSFYGPSNEFNNVTFGEYIDAQELFYDFIDTKDINYLYLLFATFYRGRRNVISRMLNYRADKRVKYNPDRTVKLANQFKHQPIGVVYGFFLLFTSFQKYLSTAKIYVQSEEIDLSILYKPFPESSKYKSTLPSIGVKSTLYSIAQSGIFGTLEKVRSTPFWEIMIRMYDIRKRDLDAYYEYKSNTNATT